MKVLKFNEEVLSFLDIFSCEVFKKTTNKYLKYLPPYVLLIIQCVYFITSAGYLLRSSGNITDWMVALVQMIVCIAATGALICLVLQMEKTERLHDQLQNIVDDADEIEVSKIYNNTEMKCQMWTKWTLIINVCAVLTILFLPSLIHSLVCMWHGNFDTSTYFLFLKLAVPFDTSNIFVWYGVLIATGLMGMGTINAFLLATVITYFMSCSFYVDACCQHFRFQYRQIEEKIDENLSRTYENIPEIKRKLSKTVGLHVKIIKVTQLVADIMGGVIFALLVPMFICLTMYIYCLDENLKQLNFTLFFIQIFISSVFLMGFPFILCSFATNITQNILSITDVAYLNISWYRLPPNLRRYVLLIILQAQQPIYLTGFKVVHCTLYNFAMSMKSAYSCYLIIRDMAH